MINQNTTSIPLSSIRFEDDDTAFTKAFNEVNDAYVAFMDESISDEEKQAKFDVWFKKKLALEMGYYNYN